MPRGAAALTPEQRKKLASAGGRSHSKAHMAEIGRRGGLKTSENKAFMSMIGRIGGSRAKVKE